MTGQSQILPKRSVRTTLRRIAVIALDGVQTLDVTGPMEVFATANEFRKARDGYEVVLGSLTGTSIRTHAGLELGPANALTELPHDLDTIVVAGGSEAAVRAALAGDILLPWLRHRQARTRRIASICTGAFILAAAGFFDGRRATTHWNSCDLLQAHFPEVQVEPDAIFVAEPPFYSSAGVTAGIDLCLALVEADLGAETALAVARELVLFLRRPGGQSQFSAGLSVPATAEPRLRKLVIELLDDPTGDRSVPALAHSAGMSERSFARTFTRDIGMPPALFVEHARLSRAKSLLEASDYPLARVAERAGFGSADALHRSFQKHVGVTPGEYRARFSTHVSDR